MKEMKTRRRVLVTGGAGFLGSHICARLLAEGHDVVCLDNFASSHRANVEHLAANKRFTILQADVANVSRVGGLSLSAMGAPDVEWLDALDGVEQIYNLACIASPRRYQAMPVEVLKTSVLGALFVLELARRNGARVLQASTSEVYGEPEVHPQPESYRGHVSCTGPRACYDEGKRAAETLFADHHRAYGVDTRIARIFNTYGPRMAADDGRVVSNFVVQALRGEALTVYGDGSQTRSFCYVDDLVEGLMRLMGDGAPHEPVNLGNPQEVTILELATRVLALSGSRAKIVSGGAMPVDDPSRRCPDIRCAIATIGWKPKTSLDAGLRHTIAYFQTSISRGSSLR